MADPKDIDGFIDSITGIPIDPLTKKVDETTPAPMPVPTAPEQKNLDTFLDRLAPAPIAPQPKTANPDLDTFLDNTIGATTADRPGLDYGFSQGIERGVAQLQSVVPTLQGVYNEYMGDNEAAARYAAEAKAIEEAAPKPIVGGFSNIKSAEDALYWMAETFGEQVPVLGATALAALAGGRFLGPAVAPAAVTASAVRAGLLSPAAASRLGTTLGGILGGSSVGVPLELADTAQELYGATGSYHPEVSTAAGVGKGLLEIMTPLGVVNRITGRTIGSTFTRAAIRTALTEGTTELAQEEIGIAARKYVDPKYNYFGEEAVWRRVDAFAAGTLVGGVVGVPAEALGRRADRGQTQDVSDDLVKYPSPLSLLKRTLPFLRSDRDEIVLGIYKQNPYLDPLELNILLDTYGPKWAGSGIRLANEEAFYDMTERATERYAVVDPDGKTRVFWNSTDLERKLGVFKADTDLKSKIVKVDEQSLVPAGISAYFDDLPTDKQQMLKRVYFLPHVPPTQQKLLLQDFFDFVNSPEAQAALESVKLEQPISAVFEAGYNRFMSAGLRVLPSAGSSYMYAGEFVGDAVDKVPRSLRTMANTIIKTPSQATMVMYSPGGKFTTKKWGDFSKTIDLNKFRSDQIMTFDVADNIDFRFPATITFTEQQDYKQRLRSAVVGTTEYSNILEELLARGVTTNINPTARIVYISKDADVERAFTATTDVERYMRAFPTQAEFERSWNAAGKKASVTTDYRFKHLQQLQLVSAVKLAEWQAVAKTVLDSANKFLASKGLVPIPEAKISASGVYYNDLNGTFYPSGTIEVEPINTTSADDVAYILWHEVGHYITYQMMNKLPTEVVEKVFTAYRRNVLADVLTDPLSAERMRSEIQIPASKAPNANDYVYKFEEYLTENFIKWASSTAAPETEHYKWFKQVGHIFKDLHKAIQERNVDNKDPIPFTDRIRPDYEFTKAMELLFQLEEETLPVFGGILAKKADSAALAQAKHSVAVGKDPAVVWKETGWYLGPDGKWRFEIDDSVAVLNTQAIQKNMYYSDNEGEVYQGDSDSIELGQILKHPTLFANYPELATVPVQIGFGEYYGTSGSVGNGVVSVNAEQVNDWDTIRKILFHEIQHIIQSTEAFENGSSLNGLRTLNEIVKYDLRKEMELLASTGAGHNYLPVLQEAYDALTNSQVFMSGGLWAPNTAVDIYKALFGEVEARNAADRRTMTAAERRQTPPWATQDTPTDKAVLGSQGVSVKIVGEDIAKKIYDEITASRDPSQSGLLLTWEGVLFSLVEEGADMGLHHSILRVQDSAKKLANAHVWGEEGVKRSQIALYSSETNRMIWEALVKAGFGPKQTPIISTATDKSMVRPSRQPKYDIPGTVGPPALPYTVELNYKKQMDEIREQLKESARLAVRRVKPTFDDRDANLYGYNLIDHLIAGHTVPQVLSDRSELSATMYAEFLKIVDHSLISKYKELALKKATEDNVAPFDFAAFTGQEQLPYKELPSPWRRDRQVRSILDELDEIANNPVVEDFEQAIAKAKEELGSLLPAGWKLEATADENVVGLARTNSKTIVLGLGAMRFGVGNVLMHELVHALRAENLFTPGEWRTLVNEIRRDSKLMAAIRAEYRNHYVTQGMKLEKQLTNPPPTFVADYVNEKLLEEAIAFTVQVRAAGGSYSDQMNTFLDRIIAFLLKVKNLLRGNGYVSPADVRRRMFTGEVTARQQREQNYALKMEKIMNATALPLDREKQINPQQIVQVADDMVIVIEKGAVDAQYRAYKPSATPLTGDLITQLNQLGNEIGVVFLSKNRKGWEVDYISMRKTEYGPEGRAESFSTTAYSFIEKDLNTKMKPSGILLEDGYKMWMKRDPRAIRYHVFDAKESTWHSPVYVRNQMLYYQSVIERTNTPPPFLKKAKEKLVKWKKLYNAVPRAAWRDPELDTMFSLDFKSYMYGVGHAMARQAQKSDERYITGEPTQPTGFEQIKQRKRDESQAENARLLGVDYELSAPHAPELMYARNILKWRELDPADRRALAGVFADADRISGFSRIWWGINQMIWANPHFSEGQEYLRTIENWVALRAQWVARADDVAKKWENLPAAERTKVTNILFYMTEMDYLSASEKRKKVVRNPTQQETQAALQQFRLSPEAVAVFTDVNSTFWDFLTAYEQVARTAIMREFINNPAKQQEALTELAKDMQSMRSRPYFPMSRFGEWSLTVRDPVTNKVLAFHTFESEKERNAYIKVARSRWIGNDIRIGRVPTVMQDFVTLPGPILRKIKTTLPGITVQQKEWLDQLEHATAPERSFRKHWMKREGTPGFSYDGLRVFSNYFNVGAGYLARLRYKDEAQDVINRANNNAKMLAQNDKRFMLVDEMQRHLNYMLESGRDGSKLRAFAAMWYLGFSPAAAAMNLSQIPLYTIPYLSSLFEGGAVKRAFSAAGSALKGTFSGIQRNPKYPGYEAVRQELIRVGRIDAGQAPELGAYAAADNLSRTAAGDAVQRVWRNFTTASMWMFSKTERFNRELTFAATFDLVMDTLNSGKKLKYLDDLFVSNVAEIAELVSRLRITDKEAVAFLAAREAIDRTQFVYAPWARPRMMRNPYVADVLVFFQYVQSALFALRHNPGHIKSLLTMAFMFGLMGMPFAEDLDKIIEAVARRFFDKDWSVQQQARELIRALTRGTVADKVGPDLLFHGISKFSFGPGLLPEGWGAPRFDASRNGSMGNIIPVVPDLIKGWGHYGKWKEMVGDAAQKGAGAGYGYFFALLQFLSQDPHTAGYKKWEAIMPRAMKAASKGARFGWYGEERSNSGAQIATFNPRDPDDLATVLAQVFGFTPLKLSQHYEVLSAQKESEMFYKGWKMTLYTQYAEAARVQDIPSMNKILAQVERYNKEVTDLGLGQVITGQQLRNSVMNRTRNRAKEEVGLPQQKSSTPLYKKIEDLYPLIERKPVK